MKLFFSTVVRGAGIEDSGELVHLDWNQKQVLRRAPVWPRDPTLDDPNPRGNTRGARGIVLVDKEVGVASYHSVHFFSQDLTPTRTITNGLFVGLHEIWFDGDQTLWATSTAIDAAVAVNVTTGDVVDAHWPREDPRLQQRLDVQPLPIDKTADNRGLFLDRSHLESPGHLHLNAFAQADGARYALLHAKAAIADLCTGTIVVEHPDLKGAHNLLLGEGTVSVSDTWGRKVRVFDLGSGACIRTYDLMQFRLVRRLAFRHDLKYRATVRAARVGLHRPRPPRPIFVRGLARADGHLFVGISPATILCLNEATGVLVDHFQYSTNVSACVHGLEAVD